MIYFLSSFPAKMQRLMVKDPILAFFRNLDHKKSGSGYTDHNIYYAYI